MSLIVFNVAPILAKPLYKVHRNTVDEKSTSETGVPPYFVEILVVDPII